MAIKLSYQNTLNIYVRWYYNVFELLSENGKQNIFELGIWNTIRNIAKDTDKTVV